MLCALTVRKLKPGTMEDFKRTFIPEDEDMQAPAGWKRFYAIRNVADENEVVTFGFFDGTLEELRASQQDNGEYDQRRAAAEEFVESVGADGVFEVVEERSLD
jgi:heme-degrading monooxygenase HmoA